MSETTTNYCPICRHPVLLRAVGGSCDSPECIAANMARECFCGKPMREHFHLSGTGRLYCYKDMRGGAVFTARDFAHV